MSEMSEGAALASPADAGVSKQAEERLAFGGPIGATAMMVLLPLLSIYLWVCVHRFGGALVLPTSSVLAEFPKPSATAALFIVAWIVFQLVLDLILPGRAYKGLVQRDGRRLVYRLNGFFSLCVTFVVTSGLVAADLLRGSMVLELLGPLLVTSVMLAYLLAGFLYVYGKRYQPPEQPEPSFRAPAAHAAPAQSESLGRMAYNYFMGTGLNPRIGKLDLKMFFESKIGMTTWMFLTFMMAHAEYEREGSLSLAMLIVCLFQLVYTVDFFWFEEAMLSTWDINYENYGFMLAFAFVTWMPFNFSLQAQYLVYAAPELSALAVVGLLLLNFVGYYIFRSSNLQKHHFRTVPGSKIWGREPEYIETKRGTRLLISGWWGIARHSNYLGDLMMALAWCLACGFGHIVPYFYFIYFAPLLIDRERRDDHHCAEKYGDDWKTYTKRVPYRIIPGIY